MFEEILFSTLRLSIPLIFAAYGGMLSEKSGVANVALESILLFSAFFSAAVTALTQNLWVGVFAGISSAALAGVIFAFFCVYMRGDQIVIGTAMNLLAVGLIPVMNRALFAVTGSTPSLPIDLRFQEPLYFFAFAMVLYLFLKHLFAWTRHGLRITAAGENPLALTTQGVDEKRVKFRAVIEGACIVGVGGIYLSLCQGSGYIRNMSAGRGFIALAALILGSWKPGPTLLACILFGFTDSVQMRLQGAMIGDWLVPNQLVQISPYLVTLIGLTLFSGKMRAPRAINQI